MAKAFNLTAEINLRGPANLKPTIAKIKSAFSGLTADVKINVDSTSVKTMASVASKLNAVTKASNQANASFKTLNSTINTLSASFSQLSSSISSTFGSIEAGSKKVKSAQDNVKAITSEIEYFGQQSGQAIRRFAAFSTVTAVIYGLNNAINDAFGEFLSFNKEVVKLSQVTGKSLSDLGSLTSEITRLSTGLGVSSKELISVASTLAQAGFSASDTRKALEALAKSSLAPSFENITETTEGAIAILRQFGLGAQDLESALGSINAVAAAFAVESQDLVSAIQRTGGVFANSSKGVSEGTDALNEFLAIFTSIRATTRESAETIATGLRTIFTRLQRSRTIDLLKELGINLTDLEGKFVGPYRAVKLLSEGLSQLDPRDIRFSQIVEELGGFRQIGKVIPLIQQFATAEQALKVAQQGQASLTKDSVIAQLSFANQLAKTRESFLALVREIGDSTTFKAFIQGSIILTDSLIALTRALEPLLPLLATFGTVKLASLGTQFLGGFLGPGGLRPNLPKKNSGGPILGFSRGGMVPGYGNTDSVAAMLTPGEFVVPKSQVQKAKYASGGRLPKSNYFIPSLQVPYPDNDTQYFATGGVAKIQGDSQSSPRIGQIAPIGEPGVVFTKTGYQTTLAALGIKPNRQKGETPDTPIRVKAYVKNITLGEESGPFSYDEIVKPGLETIDNKIKSSLAESNIKSNKGSLTGPGGKAVQDALTGYAFETFAANLLNTKAQGGQAAFDFVKPKNKMSDFTKYDPLPEYLDAKASLVSPTAIVKKAVSAKSNNLATDIKFVRARQFAKGGMVPAYLTPGEAVIGPKTASNIGYAKLHSLNRADMNGSTGFSSGGDVSIVPGSGNSDTYGPVPLPVGSFVLRKKATEALGFNKGGKVQRKVGYIDYDVIANPANKDIVEKGMEATGQSGPRLYTDYLTQLSVNARKEKSLQKLRAVYGVAGSGKTTLARGQGTDDARLRQTERFPILSPEDIQKATEVIVLSSSVSKDKLDNIFSATDRTYTLSSTTPEERERVRQQRTSRDITGKGLEGRTPGVTQTAASDTAVGEALLADKLGKKSVVLTRQQSGRLRAKYGDELVEIVKKRIGFTWGGFAPMTAGHESIMDAASAMGIAAQDFIYLVGANEGIKAGDASSYRTAIFDQDARVLLAKAGAGARGATILPKPRDFEVPQAFDISQKSGRRKVLIPGKGSTAFVADKTEEQMKKYKESGYNVVNLERTGGISGTLVRELIASGNLAKLQEVLSPGVYNLISNNIDKIQNRANIIPQIVEEVKQAQIPKIAEIDKQIKAVGITRIDNKKVATDPEYAAKAAVLEELRQKRDKIKSGAALEPYKLLAALAQSQPEKYGLDFASSPAQIKPIRTVKSGSPQKVNTGGLIRKFVNGGLYDTDGLIQKFMAGGLTEEPDKMTEEIAATKGRSEILDVLKSRKGGLEKTAAAVGAKALDLHRILGIKNPDERTKALQDAIRREYVKTVNRKTGAARATTTKLEDKEFVFGAAGLFGNAFQPTNMDIVSDRLSRSAKVRVISGVMDKDIANQLDALFMSGAEDLSDRAARLVSGAAPTGQTITNPNAEASIQGGLLEKTIQKLGGPGKIAGQGFDFPDGLQAAAKYFNLPQDIPTDVKRTLSGPATIKDNIITYLKNVVGYNSGGTVQALLTPGEAVIGPKLAKSIGLSKLNKMNYADKNQTSNYASGGDVSIVPGTGNSDSFGPVPLPVGSFVLRKKATEALGFNSGGSVRKFARGGKRGTPVPTSTGSSVNTSDIDNASKSFIDNLGGMSGVILAFTTVIQPQLEKFASTIIDINTTTGKAISEGARGASSLGLSTGLALQAVGASQGFVIGGQVAGAITGGIAGGISGFTTKKLEESINSVDNSFKKFEKTLKDTTEAATASLRLEAAAKLDAEFTSLLSNISKYNKEIQDTSDLQAFGTLVDNAGQSILTFTTIGLGASQALASVKLSGLAASTGLIAGFAKFIPYVGTAVGIIGGLVSVGTSLYSYWNKINSVSGDVIKNFQQLADVTTNQIKTGNDFNINNQQYVKILSDASKKIRATSGPGQQRERQDIFGPTRGLNNTVNEFNLAFSQLYRNTLRSNALFINFNDSINDYISTLSEQDKNLAERLRLQAETEFKRMAISAQLKTTMPNANTEQLNKRINELLNPKNPVDIRAAAQAIEEYSTNISVLQFSTDSLSLSQKALIVQNYKTIDILNRFNSIVSLSSYNLNASFDKLFAYVDDLSGQGKISPDTTAKDIVERLSNLTAISAETLKQDIETGFQMLGMQGPNAEVMRSVILSTQAIQKELPVLIRQTQTGGLTDITGQAAIEATIGRLLEPVFNTLPQTTGEVGKGFSKEEIKNTISREVAAKIIATGADKTLDMDQLAARITSETTKLLEKVAGVETVDALKKGLSEFQNALDKLSQAAQKQADVIQQITQLEIKRASLLSQTEIDIARATSQPIQTQQLNEIFNNNINKLTRGIGVNPQAIGQAILRKINEAQLSAIRDPQNVNAASALRAEINDLQSALQLISDSNDRLKNSIDNLTKVNQQMIQEGDIYEAINEALATGNIAEFAKLNELPRIFQRVMANPAAAAPFEIKSAFEYLRRAPLTPEERETKKREIIRAREFQGGIGSLQQGDIRQAVANLIASLRFTTKQEDLNKVLSIFNDKVLQSDIFNPETNPTARGIDIIGIVKELAEGVTAINKVREEAQVSAQAIDVTKQFREIAKEALSGLNEVIDPTKKTLDTTTSIWSNFNNNISGVLDKIVNEFEVIGARLAPIKETATPPGQLSRLNKIQALPSIVDKLSETTKTKLGGLGDTQSLRTNLTNDRIAVAYITMLEEKLKVIADEYSIPKYMVANGGLIVQTRDKVLETEKSVIQETLKAIKRVRDELKPLPIQGTERFGKPPIPTPYKQGISEGSGNIAPSPPPMAPPIPEAPASNRDTATINTNINLFEFLDRFKTTFGSNIDRFDNSITTLSQTFGLLSAPINKFSQSVDTLLSGLNEFNSKGGIKGPNIPEKATVTVSFDENLIVEAVGGNNARLLEQVGQITKQQIETAIKEAFKFKG